jgi:hypothetical protein
MKIFSTSRQKIIQRRETLDFQIHGYSGLLAFFGTFGLFSLVPVSDPFAEGFDAAPQLASDLADPAWTEDQDYDDQDDDPFRTTW